MRQQRSIPYRPKRGQAFLYLRNPLLVVSLFCHRSAARDVRLGHPVGKPALADTDMLVSEANRSDGRRDRKAGCVVRVCGELLIFDTKQQFATHSIQRTPGCCCLTSRDAR